MSPIRKVNNDVDTDEMFRPVGVWSNVADWTKLAARYRFGRAPAHPEHGVPAFGKPIA
jgi:hypothetical protein